MRWDWAVSTALCWLFLDVPGQGGNAGAALNGKSYTIKGTATGVDTSNPQQPQKVTKPFEMDVTCP